MLIKTFLGEHREAHKVELSEYNKQYWVENKEELTAKNRKNCEKYRNLHRNKINEKQNEKVLGECGYQVSRQHLTTHKRSNKYYKIIINQ